MRVEGAVLDAEEPDSMCRAHRLKGTMPTGYSAHWNRLESSAQLRALNLQQQNQPLA